MKKLLFILLFVSSQSFAAITELKSYKDLDLNQIDSETLVVFDIDNTLIRQNHMVGTHQWGDYFRDRGMAAGLSKTDAQNNQYKAFAEIQPYLNVVTTEPEVLTILKTLEVKKVPHLALTARSAVLKQTTLKQIEILQHSFAKNFPAQKDAQASLGDHFYQGVIFSGDVPKGELLLRIIQNSVNPVKKVIFVDDKKYNLDSVESSLATTNIMLQSLRYGAADSYVESFDPAIADIIYSFFKESGIILSDDEAEQLVGHTDSVADLRFALYLDKQGPLAKDAGGCEAAPTTQVFARFNCQYLYDGIKSSITFDFSLSPLSQALYFGNW